MADIKQAAIWMREGKRVRRPKPLNVPEAEWAPSLVMHKDGFVSNPDDHKWRGVYLMVDSLLADDWEIALAEDKTANSTSTD